MKHYLKLTQPYFDEVAFGSKKFEVRKKDRDFQEGHFLILQEYDTATDTYSGHKVNTIITYILDDERYCKDGFVIIGFEIMNYL